jgi:hypothetical protein
MSADSPLRTWWPLVPFAVLTVAYVELRMEIGDLRAQIVVPPAAPPATVSSPPAPVAAPTPTTAPWSCDGQLTPDQVRQGLAAGGRSVFACFDAHARPGAAGSLVLWLKVGADGAVQEARFDGTLSAPAVSDCALREAVRWRFSPLASGACAVVSAPFDLGRPAP